MSKAGYHVHGKTNQSMKLCDSYNIFNIIEGYEL